MDHMEIISAVLAGKILEISSQTRFNDGAHAFLDGKRVSVSQAVRAIRNPMIKVAATASEWTAYSAAKTETA